MVSKQSFVSNMAIKDEPCLTVQSLCEFSFDQIELQQFLSLANPSTTIDTKFGNSSHHITTSEIPWAETIENIGELRILNL